MSTPPESSNSSTSKPSGSAPATDSSWLDSVFGPQDAASAPSATASSSGGLSALESLLGNPRKASLFGPKRTHDEMASSDDEAGTSTDGPPAKRTTGASGGAAAAQGVEPSKFTLTPAEEAYVQRVEHKPSDAPPNPELAVLSVTHFDPDFDYIVNPETSPPRALTWWNKVAAKFRPGLPIRDIGFDPLLPTPRYGETVPEKHSRWWLPTGDIVINLDNRLFRLHKSIIEPHLLSLRGRWDLLERYPKSDEKHWYTDGDKKLPLLNLTPDKAFKQCDHDERRQGARYLARIEAKGHGWGPESEEETILLVKALAECDYIEDMGKIVCRCPTPRDFSLVCQMIYSPRTFFNRGAIYFEDLERMLSLSEHYQCLRLRDCAVSGLTMLFPTTLDHHRHYTRNNAIRLVPASYAIDTLHLAIHYHIPELLLVAMYTLSNYDHRFLIHGILDPTRNSEWKVVPFDSTVSINGVNVNQVADIRRVPAPVRVQDLDPRQREVYKNTLRSNAEERREAAETNRFPSIVFDPEFEQREILVHILRGRALLQTARRDIVFGFLREIPSFPDELGEIPNRRGAEWDPYGYKFSEHCTSLRKDDIQPTDSVSCATVLKELMTTMWELEAERFTKNRSLNRPRHALRVLALRITGEYEEEWRHALCPSCLSKFKFEMKRGQQELWSRLPELFGMKSWFDIEMEGRRMTEKTLGYWLLDDYKEYTERFGGADELLSRKDTSYLDYWPVRRTA